MFSEVTCIYDWQETTDRIMSKSVSDVERALTRNNPGIEDFMALVSPAADPYLEKMAVLSRKYTRERFGKTISMYIPMYMTNSCTNSCVYCGFNRHNRFERVILTMQQIKEECKAIRRLAPFDNILLVTGEGLNGVVCFQETYNRDRYRMYYPAGMKSNFEWRLNGFDRMGQAGLHRIGMGVLIGLEDWRTDVTMMATHLQYLRKNYWRTRFSVNFPRMRPATGGYQPNVVMTDRELAQLIFAFRIFDHDVDITLSTREHPDFRDNMMTLGVTSMSAGSKTDPGGYHANPQSLEQFEVSDGRTPVEVAEAIRKKGYEVVWKDWDRTFD